MVLLSNIIGLPIGWLMIQEWLSKYPYRVEIGVQEFSYVILINVAIAFITVITRSYSVANSNPVDVLKNE